MVTTQGESDDSSSQSKEENEEVANLCLMAQEDEVTSEFLDDSYNELHGAFANLILEFEKLSSKYRKLEVRNQLLLKKNTDLFNCKNKLSEDNDRLSKEVDKLKPIVDKFTMSSQKLNLILDNQKVVFDKARLGYNPNKNQKYLRNMTFNRIIFTSKTAYYKLDKVNMTYTESALSKRCGYQKKKFFDLLLS